MLSGRTPASAYIFRILEKLSWESGFLEQLSAAVSLSMLQGTQLAGNSMIRFVSASNLSW